MDATTMLDVEMRMYNRERYACHLRLSPQRVDQRAERYGEKERIIGVMTRWLARCVRDQPIVTGRARVEIIPDLMTEWYMLRAEAYAFQDVHPDDRSALVVHVDSMQGNRLVIPVLSVAPRTAGEG